MKNILFALLASICLLSACDKSNASDSSSKNSNISAEYIGTWQRVDNLDFIEQKIEIQQTNANEFNIKLTKSRPQRRYSNNSDKKSLVTKNFTATLTDGILHIDNGGMEITTLTYHLQNQTLETTQSWSFPDGVFKQTSQEALVQMKKRKDMVQQAFERTYYPLQEKINSYYYKNEKYPASNEELGLTADSAILKTPGIKTITILPEGGFEIAFTSEINPEAPATMTITPKSKEEWSYNWSCTAKNMAPEILPKECQL